MKRRTRLLIGGAAVAVLGTALTVGWLARTATTARAELAAARAELAPLQTGVLTGAADVPARVQRLQQHAAAARHATDDPVWSAAGHVPWLGRPIATVRGLTEAVDVVSRESLPALTVAATDVHPATALSGGAVDVVGLAKASPTLAQAAGSLEQQRRAVARLQPSWIGAVAHARDQLLGQLTTLSDATSAASTVAEVAPSMLGSTGPRRYFVGFQNPAEARGTGGLLDAFAIIRAEKGRLVVERSGANTDLPKLPTVFTDVPEGFAERYAEQGGLTIWVNSNLSPDFREVGAAWLAMWKAATGQQLDGAVALDPRALAAVLRATGPVSAPVVGTVEAGRVENLVLLEQYQRQELAAKRKQLMLGVGLAAIDAVLSGRASPQQLFPDLDEAARGKHVLIYSRHAPEQTVLVGSAVGGAVIDDGRPFAQAVVINTAGSKLDSWLHQSLAYQVERCTGRGREVAVSLELRNDAPTTGLPAYVTIRSDDPSYEVVSGQNRVEARILATKGARFVSATLDGVSVAPSPPEGVLPDDLPVELSSDGGDVGFIDEAPTAGHPSWGLELELVPGVARTLTVRFVEPVGVGGEPVLGAQPLVIPPRATADITACP